MLTGGFIGPFESAFFAFLVRFHLLPHLLSAFSLGLLGSRWSGGSRLGRSRCRRRWSSRSGWRRSRSGWGWLLREGRGRGECHDDGQRASQHPSHWPTSLWWEDGRYGDAATASSGRSMTCRVFLSIRRLSPRPSAWIGPSVPGPRLRLFLIRQTLGPLRFIGDRLSGSGLLVLEQVLRGLLVFGGPLPKSGLHLTERRSGLGGFSLAEGAEHQ